MINLRKLKTDVLRELPDAIRFTPFALIVGFVCLAADASLQAQVVGGGTDPTTILKAISTYILGPFGQALAVLACIGVGITFMFGRLGMLHLGGFVAGLAIIFGSAFLVNQFLGA